MVSQAITLHTFFVIFFRWTPGPRSVWIYRIIISLIWTYTTLFVGIAYSKHRAYNPADPDIFFVRPLFTKPSPLPTIYLISESNSLLVLDQRRVRRRTNSGGILLALDWGAFLDFLLHPSLLPPPWEHSSGPAGLETHPCPTTPAHACSPRRALLP